MDSEFNWIKLNLHFPEWASVDGKKEEVSWKGFTLSPTFKNGVVDFALGDYGFQLFVQNFLPWLGQVPGVEERYKVKLKQVYEQVREELEQCMSIFESWRPNVNRGTLHGHESRSLSNHLEFTQSYEKVHDWDYWKIAGKKDVSPTDQLLFLKGLPTEILNEKFLAIQKLGDFVSESNWDCNNISGDSLVDCVNNANAIYLRVSRGEFLNLE
mgnify:CR=1 FL=1